MQIATEVSTALKVRLPSDTGAQWLLKDPSWAAAAAAANRHLALGCGPIEQLKIGRNRDIFRLDHPDFPVSCIAKTFPMSTLKQKLLRYRRYGPAEAVNLLRATARDIRAPELYGFGWQQKGPLVERTMVMMEDLRDYTALAELQGDSLQRALDGLGEVLLGLYRGGCNHIDLGPGNILVSNDDADVRLIDFMYTAFLPYPNAQVFAFHTAYVSQGLQSLGIAESCYREWAHQLFRSGQVDASASDLMTDYELFIKCRLSRKERLALGK